jgi:hypothetical protein
MEEALLFINGRKMEVMLEQIQAPTLQVHWLTMMLLFVN